MATKPHSTVSQASNHPIDRWTYANAAARTGATGFTAAHLNTVAHQQDNDTYWILLDATPTWLQVATGSLATFTAASVPYADGSGVLVDDGANFSYASGVVTLSTGLTFTSGGTIATTNSSNLVLLPDISGITVVGNAGSTTHALTANNDLFVSGKFEVDGVAYFDNVIEAASTVQIRDNVLLAFGSSSEARVSYSKVQTAEALIVGVPPASRSTIFCEQGDMGTNFGHSLQANPTIFTHSSDATDTTQWASFAHDQTDAVIASGAGTIKLAGGVTHNLTTVNAATYDLLISDYFVHVTYTGTGAVTSLTLPTAQTLAGRTIVIKDAGGNASANNITVDTQASETIDGAATVVMNADYEWLSLYSDGSDWFIKGN